MAFLIRFVFLAHLFLNCNVAIAGPELASSQALMARYLKSLSAHSFKDALTIAEALCRREPNNASYLVARGKAYYYNEAEEAARADFLKAASMSGVTQDDFSIIVSLLAESEYYDDATRLSKLAVEKYPLSDFLNLQAGKFARKAGKLKESLAYIDCAIKYMSNDKTSAWLERAYTDKQLKDWPALAHDCDMILLCKGLNPHGLNVAKAREMSAMANYNLGHKDKALADYSMAIKAFPMNSNYYRERAKLYVELGKKKEAEQDRARADEVEMGF